MMLLPCHETTVAYLTYVTDKNRSYRFDDFYKSLTSLDLLRDGLLAFNMVSVDNASSGDVRDVLRGSDVFSDFVHYDTNMYDVGLFYAGLWKAQEHDSKYVAIMYDDFEVYDGQALNAAADFLRAHEDVACVRLPVWSFNEMSKYDSRVVSKSSQPDAVRHNNDHTGESLCWDGPHRHWSHDFYKTNWHYTSRPCLWRVTDLAQVLPDEEEIPVLQGFESLAKKRLHDTGKKVGALDGGMMRSAPADRSARTNELKLDVEMRTRVKLADLRAAYDRTRG